MEGMGVKPIEAVGQGIRSEISTTQSCMWRMNLSERTLLLEELQKGYTYKGFRSSSQHG